MRKRAAGPTTMAAEARQRVQAWLDRERKLSEALTAARPGARSSAGRPMSQNGKRRSLKEGAVTRSRNCFPYLGAGGRRIIRHRQLGGLT
jgi:hypothetical protein